MNFKHAPFKLAPVAGLVVLGVSLITACSGGGGSSPAPGPTPTLGGLGPTFTFDQHANFTVIVPPPATLNAVAALRRRRLGAAAVSNPYVSPNTESITLQVETVNGQSPRVLPPLQAFSVTCPGAAGCSVPIQNVAAATGVDRFAVQTFSGPGGTGNLISTGIIDVTVPSTQSTSLGGTSLTIGGFVKALTLTASIPAGAFLWHTPATGTIDVNAIDPAGAIIIGNDQLANPIAVTLPSADAGAFLLNGVAEVDLQQPGQALALAYNGAPLLSGSVAASTVDENSQPVATTVPIAIKPPPTPTPKPVPSAKPALSLYVVDGNTDRVYEFGGVNDVESGHAFNSTPRRAFDLAQPASLDPATVSCNSAGSPFLAAMAFGTDGTMYAQTFCSDSATGTAKYIFAYAPSAVDTVVPGASPAPPVPKSVFAVSADPFTLPQGIGVDASRGTLVLQYSVSSPVGNGGGSNIIGVSLANPATVTANFGSFCLQELGFSSPSQSCNIANSPYGYLSASNDFALDSAGNVYIPTLYGANDSNSNPITPPGSATEAIPGEPTVVLFPPNLNDPQPTPRSAIAGFDANLGPANAAPYVSIEGSTLYALVTGGTIQVPGNNASNIVYAGLSSCSAIANAAQVACAGQSPVEYIAGYAGATTALAAASAGGQNIIPNGGPTFMLGGDAVGGFGQPLNNGIGFEEFAVRDGFAFVLNGQPPSGGPPEVDVYNMNAVTGSHIDVPPVTRLVLNPTLFPSATTIAIGPTGSAVTPASLLRMPARVHHDVKAWAARRKALLEQRRRRFHP